MTKRTIYTDINEANAEIRDMETHMDIMKRMISVQSERIENLKTLVEVLEKHINSNKAVNNNHLKLMKTWLNALEKNQVGLVMESIDRTLGNNKIKQTIWINSLVGKYASNATYLLGYFYFFDSPQATEFQRSFLWLFFLNK